MQPINPGFYFDTAAEGVGFCFVPASPREGIPAGDLNFAWFGFDRSGGRLFVVGQLKPMAPSANYPGGFYMGDAISARGDGPRPGVASYERQGSLWVSERDGRLFAQLRLRSRFLSPVDFSPLPPEGAEETIAYSLAQV